MEGVVLNGTLVSLTSQERREFVPSGLEYPDLPV
jgi:hypothetical protein